MSCHSWRHTLSGERGLSQNDPDYDRGALLKLLVHAVIVDAHLSGQPSTSSSAREYLTKASTLSVRGDFIPSGHDTANRQLRLQIIGVRLAI